jgi:hypothetical protein
MENSAAVSRGSPLVGSNADANELCIDAIRMLAIDAVQRANSGYPGMPMGAATMARSSGSATLVSRARSSASPGLPRRHLDPS